MDGWSCRRHHRSQDMKALCHWDPHAKPMESACMALKIRMLGHLQCVHHLVMAAATAAAAAAAATIRNTTGTSLAKADSVQKPVNKIQVFY